MSSVPVSEREPQTEVPKLPPQGPAIEPEEPKGSSARKWIIVLIVLAIIAGAVWKIRSNTQEVASQNSRLAAAGDRPVPVLMTTVEQKTMPIYLTGLGTVTAYNSVTIKSRVDGQLLQVPVREGQAVKKGQLLAQIDPAPYAAAVAQAEGMLVKDQANATNANAEAARYTALLQAGVVSKESQQTQVSSAGQMAGSIAADKAAIQAARVNLEYTRITSPIDGVVGLRQVDPGNIVHASDTTGLLLVTQLQPIAVIFTLPEDQLPQVQTVMRAGGRMVVDAYDRSNTTRLATGSLLTLDNQIDTTTGTVKAKAVFDNRDGMLFPNQFVNVRLVLQDRRDAIVIPAAALQTGSQGTFVYVVKPGQPPVDPNATGDAPSGSGPRKAKAAGAGSSGPGSPDAGGASGPPPAPYYVESRPVKVDLTEGTQVILLSGLSKGEQIVIDGQEKLKPNARVIPRDPNAGAGGGGRRGGMGQAGTGQTGAGQGAGQGAAQGAQGAGAGSAGSTPGTRGSRGRNKSEGTRP
jgi:multidrug efflux system membrane fusion protein